VKVGVNEETNPVVKKLSKAEGDENDDVISLSYVM